MAKVVHFEIPVDDPARAREFYGAVFDWGLQVMEEIDYTLVLTTDVDEQTQMPKDPGAINGGLMRRTAETPVSVITINVDSIVDSLKQIEAGGGSVVKPRTEMGEMGSYAYFKDTEGNVVGLFENA